MRKPKRKQKRVSDSIFSFKPVKQKRVSNSIFAFKPIKINSSNPIFDINQKARKINASPMFFGARPQKKSLFSGFGVKTDMNWKQAKKAYPKLKPFGDIDKDGVRNKYDCKPFDFSLQGPKHKKKYLSEEGELRVATLRDRIRDKAYKLTHSPPEISEEDKEDGWHRNQFDPYDIVRDNTEEDDKQVEYAESGLDSGGYSRAERMAQSAADDEPPERDDWEDAHTPDYEEDEDDSDK